MHFSIKNTFKNNHNHTLNPTLKWIKGNPGFNLIPHQTKIQIHWRLHGLPCNDRDPQRFKNIHNN